MPDPARDATAAPAGVPAISMSYGSTILEILPVFFVLAVGFLLRRIGILQAESDRTIIGLTIWLLVPCFILDHIPGNKALMEAATVGSAVAAGFLLVTFGFGAGYLAGPLFGLERGSGRRTFSIAAGLQNYGYLAIPVVQAFFPEGEVIGVLLVHNVGVDCAVWTVGVMMLSGASGAPVRNLINGPLIAIIVALTLNGTGWYRLIPEPVGEGIGWLGACAIPLSLLLVGATISDLLGQPSWLKSWKLSAGGCLLRLAFLPLVFLAVAVFLPLSPELKRVLVIQGALPSGVFPVVLARHYGGHPATAVQVVLSTTLAGIFTMPLWIGWGLRLIGAR